MSRKRTLLAANPLHGSLACKSLAYHSVISEFLMKVEKPTQEAHFPTIEQEILKTWDNNRTFQKSVESRPSDKHYNFYDGPPFATGLPHYGHLLAGSIKDAFPRFFTMKGYRVERRFGWDCHGLPIELLIQKELGLTGRKEIQDFGVAKFNDACRKSVLRYTKEWREYVKKSGRWVDMENEYRTMDKDYMESVWAVFKILWDKKLVYQGKKILSYSPELASSLSNSEASMNYKDIQDPSITVRAKLIDGPFDNTNLLVWTTTPWTLLANVAVAVDPKSEYSLIEVKESGERLIIHQARVSEYFKKPEAYELIKTISGRELVSLSYEPFFPYFKDQRNERCHRIYAADFVTADTGTGAVHIAPNFGEDDFNLSKEVGLPLIDHLDHNGCFISGGLESVTGKFFKDGDKLISQDLKNRGLMFRHDTFVHSYPHCYRSEKPLIYRAMPSWFVDVTKIKASLLEHAKSINWVPLHLKEGRFGKWLENAKDWNIARERYWGTPIPIWLNDAGEIKIIGSIAELQEFSSQPIDDIHIDSIDHIEIPSETGGPNLKRVPYVFDCWFESGSMPYAQMHFPFENAEDFKDRFPADFICEGLDQTRCWFYYLTVLSVGALDKPAFKNVVVNGILLAEDGHKMSKSLKNFPDPMLTVDSHGADAMRLAMLNSPASAAEELRFSVNSVKEVTRRMLLPLWNAYSFFATYGNLIEYDPETHKAENQSPQVLDQWILIRLNELVRQVDQEMSAYRLAKVAPAILDFLDDLNNWYIRRNRRRFWEGDLDAFNTLYDVLLKTCQLLAPLAPFLSDYIFRKLSLTPDLRDIDGVHLTNFPQAKELSEAEQELLTRVDTIRQAVELGRSIRKTHQIKNRQPLKEMTVGVVNVDKGRYLTEMEEVVKDELNIKKLSVTSDPSQLAQVVVKPNFKVMGKIFGKRMKEVQAKLKDLPSELAERAFAGEAITLDGDVLEPHMLQIELTGRNDRLVAANSQMVAALDQEINDDLKREGLARELVSLIQKSRKLAGLAVEDRIDLSITPKNDSEILGKVVEEHGDYISQETLALFATSTEGWNDFYNSKVAIDDLELEVALKKRPNA